MWTITEIKQIGRNAFKRNYWPCVGAGILLSILGAGGSAAGSSQTASTDLATTFNQLSPDDRMVAMIAVFSGLALISLFLILFKIFVYNPLKVGCYHFYKRNVTDDSTGFGVIGEGFNNYGHTFVTLFLKDLFIVLWSLLLVVPGIIKAYSYRLVPFLVKDHPELSASQILALSSNLMQGNKGRAFLMDLSFIGWHLLGILTFGIGEVLWTTPYTASSDAALYLELTSR